MGRNKLGERKVLKHQIKTRVSSPTMEKLQKILAQKPDFDMSTLVRNILENRQIKIFTEDRTLDNVMEELSALRAQIKSIGVNINQITRLFNTYPEEKKKEFYAKIAFQQYVSVENKMDRLLEIITKLSNRWL